MQPGRELDALVAEQIMGWTWGQADPSEPGLRLDPPGSDRTGYAGAWKYGDEVVVIGDTLPHYSTDRGVVWQVVDQMGKPSDRFKRGATLWLTGTFAIFTCNKYSDDPPHEAAYTEGEQEAHAICLAALAAWEAFEHVALS